MNPNKKIKVALMSYAMDHRQAKGSALSTHRLIERLVKDPSLEVTLVHFEPSDDPLYKLAAAEVIMPRVKLPAGTRFVRTLLFFWKYRKQKFDVIHWFQSRVYPFFWFAPAHHIVVTAHAGGDVTSPGKFPLSRRMFNFTLTHFNHYVDAIIGVSNFGKQEIIDAYGADPKRVFALIHYNGGAEEYVPMDKERARSEMRRYGVDGPYILDVSRLSIHKNVTTLIQAYILLRDQHPERKELLVIAGGPDNNTAKIHALAHGSTYAADIRFIDFIEQHDMNALYSGADVFAFPSLSEGFGMPLIEAFASGTPIVTSSVASMPEVSAGAALLIDPNSAQDLADAMFKLLTDENLRKDLIQKGLERCREFTWDRAAEEVSELYRRVVHS